MCVLPYVYFGTMPNVDIDLGPGAHSISRFTTFFSGSAGTAKLYTSTDGTTYTRVALWDTYRAFATHDSVTPFTGRYLRLRPFGISIGSWQVMEVAAWECP